MMKVLALLIAIPGALALWAGVRIFLKLYEERRVLRRYDFEHRTTGGTIIYDNFEATENRQRKENSMILRALWGTFLSVAGFLWVSFFLSWLSWIR